MLFKEIFLDLRNSKNGDPHPMWDLFKMDHFQLSSDLVDSLSITKEQKSKLKDLLGDHEELFKEIEKNERLFDDQFWLNFLLGVRDQGCHESSSDLPVPITCSGDIRNMTWSQINTLVTKDYGDILTDQIVVPEIKLEVEDKNELAKRLQKDFENKVKGKSTEEREKIKKEMKTTIKAKHLHEIRARDAEVKVMDDILQSFKVKRFYLKYKQYKNYFKTFLERKAAHFWISRSRNLWYGW